MCVTHLAEEDIFNRFSLSRTTDVRKDTRGAGAAVAVAKTTAAAAAANYILGRTPIS